MAQTEYDELLFKTDFDLSQATDKINKLKSQLSVVNTELEEASKNFNLNLIASLEAQEHKLKSALNSLNSAVKAERIIGNLSDTLGKAYRGIDGIAVSSIEHLAQISANWRTISRQLNAVYAQTAGLDNLYSQMVYKGQNIKQSFGTDYGRQFLANKYQKQGYTMQASNAVYDSTVEEAYANVRAQNEQRRKIEAIRLAGMTEAERDAEKLAKHQENLNKRLGTTQLQVMANYTVINKLTNAFKGLINYTVQYDEELHQLQAISAMSNASLDKTRQTIEAVAVSTEFTSLELAKASTVLAQAGLSATQIQGTLPAIAKLATATGTDLATSTDVITSTLNVYNMQVSEAEHVTNALTTAVNESKSTIPSFQTALQYAGNTASQLGISFEETAAAISAATQAGIRSKSILGTGMRAVLTEFLKPTPKLIAQLNKLGLTMDDIDVRTKGYVNVLKTLKNAGFGVEEAYKGMERRGAAFLAAQLNQTDFMDELRLKMASSTAASKANETQMEALAKQWKNFKNVLGTAATDGLQPLISLMSNLLKIVNSFSQTTLGGGIFQLLVAGGGGLFALKSFEVLKNSVVGLAKGLGALGSNSKSISAYGSVWNKMAVAFDLISARSGAVQGVMSSISVLFSGLSTGGWIALLTTAGILIYKLVDGLGLLTSKAEEARQEYEELKGTLEENKTEQELIQEFQARLVRDRTKLEDPTERRIFLQEILTRLPKANEYLNSATTSVDDFKNALDRLNNTNLNTVTENLQKASEAAREAIPTGSEDVMKNVGYYVNTKDIKALLKAYTNLEKQGLGIMSAGEFFAPAKDERSKRIQAERINRAIVENDMPYRKISTIGIDKVELKKNMDAIASQMIESVANNPKYLTNKDRAGYFTTLALEEANKALAPILNNTADYFKTLGDSVDHLNKSEVFKAFEDRIDESTKIITKSLNSTNESIKRFELYKDIEMPAEELNKLQLTYTLAQQNLEALSNRSQVTSYEEIAQALGLRSADEVQELKNNTEGLKNLTPDEFIKAWNDNGNNKVIEELRGAIISAITKLEQIAQEQGLVLRGASSVTQKPVLDELTKQLKNSNKATLQENYKKAQEGISTYIDIRKQENVKNDPIIAKAIENNEIKLKQELDAEYARLLDRFNKGAEKIDPLKREMDKFFNDLDASIKQLSTTYREAIKPLDDMLARRKGIIEAASRFYGSSSGIVSAEEVGLRKLEESQTGARLEAAKAKRQGLVEQRTALRESSLFKNIIPAYEEAEKGYYAAIGSKNNAMALKYQKSMDSLSSNYKKLASKDDELTKSINDLDKEIEEATYILTQLDVYKNMSAGDQVMYGVGSAMTNYVDQNKQFQTIGGSAEYLADNVISNLDSGFTSLFQNIISGSKRAGDAFKDFGRQILETIRDIAIQMAVKQGLSALFSSFAGSFSGGVTETGGVNSWSYVTTKGQATGGIVNGPVKNRDSVNMKLMPGEYVLKKSAVDVIGRDYLDSLNDNASAVLNASAESVGDARTDTESNTNTGAGGTVNVYVVGQEQQQAMTPSDVLVTITQDMLTGGQTKRLVKSIAMGAL